MADSVKEAPALDQQERLLAIAEELRLKRETGRDNLSKSQLKKARRKLSRLYHQALQQPGGDQPEAYSMAEETESSMLCLGSAGCLGPAASDFTDASITAAQALTGSTVPAEQEEVSVDVQGLVNPTSLQIECTSSHNQGAAPPATVARTALPFVPSSRVLPRPGGRLGGRGRHMDMSGVMHALHAQLRPAPADSPGAVGAVQLDSTAHPGQDHNRSAHSLRSKVTVDSVTGAHHQATQRAAANAVPLAHLPRTQQQQQGERLQQQAAGGSVDTSQDSTGQTTQPGAKKRPRQQFIYGNYHGYYGYRHASVGAFEDDPRLELLQPAWFEGRHLLDVGCNEGLVTLAAAVRWGPASTTGVDIDTALVGKACRNLRSLRANVTEQLRQGPTYPPPTPRTQTQLGQTQRMSGSRVEQQQQQSVGGSLPSNCSAGTGAAASTLLLPSSMMTDGADAGPSGGATQAGRFGGGPGSSACTGMDVCGAASDLPQHTAEAQAGAVEQPQLPPPQQQQEQAPAKGGKAQPQAAGPSQRPPPARGLHPGVSSTRSWAALRTAARALSSVQFHALDWANQEEPRQPAAATPATHQQHQQPAGSTAADVTPQPAGAAITTQQQQQQQQQQQGGRPPHQQQQRPLRLRRQFGVIMCLSVTKWVHLNWGDEGLMRLFNKFNRCLEQGGYLVLEPQPWRSYEAALVKKHTAGVAVRDLQALKLRPEDFTRLLVQELGFQLVADLNKSNTAVGFDRPMCVFRKQQAPGPRPTQSLQPLCPVALDLNLQLTGAPGTLQAGAAGASGAVASQHVVLSTGDAGDVVAGGQEGGPAAGHGQYWDDGDDDAGGSDGGGGGGGGVQPGKKRRGQGAGSWAGRRNRRQPRAEDLLAP